MAFKKIKEERDFHLTKDVYEDHVIVLTEGFYRKIIYDDDTSIWYSKAAYRNDFTRVYSEKEVTALYKIESQTVFY